MTISKIYKKWKGNDYRYIERCSASVKTEMQVKILPQYCLSPITLTKLNDTFH